MDAAAVDPPVVSDRSFVELEEVDDPYAWFAARRGEGPVVRTADGFVVTTTRTAAEEVLRHPAAASSPIGARYLEALPPGAARDEMAHRINFLDPPDHPRVRGLVSKAFTPRRMASLRPYLEATAHALLDDLLPAGGFDLVHDYAHQVPALAISELLGVPPDEREALTALSDAVTPLLGVQVDAAEMTAAIEAAEVQHARLGALLEQRSAEPGDDLLTALLAAEEDGERLSRPELLSLAATLYSAGHRTTRDLTANGVAALLDAPGGWPAVAGGELDAPALVSELLRFETPTLFVARLPAAPMVVDGVQLVPSDIVLVLLGAANRDPAAYDDPDRLDVGRWQGSPQPPPVLSFAFGPHYCLGANLARLEAEVLLTVLAERAPTLRAVGDERRWRQRGPFRSLEALPVEAG